MSADPWTIALSVGGGVLTAFVTAISTTWILRGTLATKHDIDEIRADQEKHERKDDDRWDTQGQKSERLTWILGKVAGHLGVQTDEDDPSPPRRRASRQE